MLWGKLIDHDRCIGCHACSVACKSENQVPLGVFRTWVKQVEKGAGENARRHFGVMRCNQCENAPCVAICPTAAMHRRPDGIVDFDAALCIGCKGCIQACPYDAIYIDPESNTAAKCNFCAHRIEVGLEPACVAACPTEALVVGDLEDPDDPLTRTISRKAVEVRKPELGTQPKVYYKGVDQSLLNPRAATRPAAGYWGASRDVPHEELSVPFQGAPAAARVAYDVPREGLPWGGKIATYLFAKSVGGGALMLGGAALALGAPPAWIGLWGPLFALVGIAVATVCLVADLKRPERFLLLLFRPQPKSWLVKGAYVLIASSVLAAAWGAGVIREGLPKELWQVGGVLCVLAGAATTGYTAFLFAQAKGRAFWQSPLLLPHLVIQGLVAGSAALALFPGWAGIGPASPVQRPMILGSLLAAALLLNLLCVIGELTVHGNEDAKLAVTWLREGDTGGVLTWGVLVLGHIFPLFVLSGLWLLDPVPTEVLAVASPAALIGLWIWEHLYVQAGQVPPLS
ncbi:MAG: polysulfide reductase NrfD [Planctomycetes bacterium]|nr:polysulfide reductase NrfD [Planctomycetota bacterium]